MPPRNVLPSRMSNAWVCLADSFRFILPLLAALSLAPPVAAQVSPPALTSTSPDSLIQGTSGTLYVWGTNLRMPLDSGYCSPGPANQVRIVYRDAMGIAAGDFTIPLDDIFSTYMWDVPFTEKVTEALSTVTLQAIYEVVSGSTVISQCHATNLIEIPVRFGILPIEMPSGFVGEPFGPVTLRANGATGSVIWSLEEQSVMPPGLSLSSSGVISGTPSERGWFGFQVRATDSANPQITDTSWAYIDIWDRITILPETLPNGVVGQSYSQAFDAGDADFVYTEDELPPGLSIEWDPETNTYRLEGVPEAVGTYTFTVEAYGYGYPTFLASDSATPNEVNGSYGFREYTLEITSGVVVTTTQLAPATLGLLYQAQLQSNQHVEVPVSWALSVGSLPPGLALNAQSGAITGTPTMLGLFEFSVVATVQSDFGPLSSPPQALAIAVLPSFAITTRVLPGATLAQPYSFALQFAGSPTPNIWELLSGSLPAGITLNAATGVLSGTPTQLGNFPFSVRIGQSTTQVYSEPVQLTITVAAPPLTLTPTSLPRGQVTVPYSQTLTPGGGVGSYQLSLQSGSLPPGLEFVASTNTIAGTPTQTGVHYFVLLLTSGEGRLEQEFSIEVLPAPLRLLTTRISEGYQGEPYPQQVFEAAGGYPPYRFELSGGRMAQGLFLNAQGVLSGEPSVSGTFTFDVTVVDERLTRVTRTYTLTLFAPLVLIGPSPLPAATEGEAYSANLQVTGGKPTYAFDILAGALPEGFALSSGGVLSGTPTEAGAFVFTARVTDVNGRESQRSIELQVIGALGLEPPTLPDAVLLREYNFTLQRQGGVGPYVWAIAGDLPPGVLFENGVFRGAPTAIGVFNFTVSITDSRQRSLSRAYAITVTGGIFITTATLPAATAGEAYQATLEAEGGRAPYRWSVTPALPEGMNLEPALGILSGSPSSGGNFTFTVRVEDLDGLSDTAELTLAINLPPPPVLRITELPPTTPPGQQPTFALVLNEPYPLPLDGEVDLTFAPARGPDDPAVQFSNGARRLFFTVPAGQTRANFAGAPSALQTGTVAGVITLTSHYRAAGQDVTPSPAPTQTLTIEASAPVLTRIDLVRTPNGFELIVFGFSTPRDATRATVRLTPAAGATLTNNEFNLDVATLFTTWYNAGESTPFGSQFRLTLPFSLSGSAADIQSATVSLTNSVGTSNSLTANF